MNAYQNKQTTRKETYIVQHNRLSIMITAIPQRTITSLTGKMRYILGKMAIEKYKNDYKGILWR